MCAITVSAIANAGGQAPDPPPAGQIAYIRSDRAGSDLFVINADGSGRRRLTETNAEESRPAISPDGRQILFVRSRFVDREPLGPTLLNGDLFVINVNGTNEHRLTRTPADEVSGTYSPDGETIAFSAHRRDNYSDIFVMNADGSARRALTTTGDNDFDPAYSPDGTQIAYTHVSPPGIGDIGVYAMNADGTNQHDLTTQPNNDFSEQPDYAPDGGAIAYTRIGTGFRIFVMGADGTSSRPLTRRSSAASAPTYSPDGRQLGFVSDEGDSAYISIMSAGGGGARRLKGGRASEEGLFDWGPLSQPAAVD